MSRFCYTLFQYDQWAYRRILKIPCVYHVVGEECTMDGIPHLQGYIEFSSSVSFRFLKRKLGRTAHIEKARKDRKTNTLYCCKAGNYVITIPPRPSPPL